MKLQRNMLIEAGLLVAVAVFGILAVNHFVASERQKNQHELKSELYDAAFELSVETLGAMNITTSHYDAHAEKLGRFERLSNQLHQASDTQSGEVHPLVPSITDFLNSVTGYMQLASTLRVSFRVISQSPELEVGTPGVMEAELMRLVNLTSSYRNSADPDLAAQIVNQANWLDAVVSGEASNIYQWSMLTKHARYIATEYGRALELLEPIENTQVNEDINSEITRLGFEIESNRNLAVLYGLAALVSVFLYLFTMLARLTINLRVASIESLQAAEVKSQFLANMSHELRTPLNGIVGLSNLLKRTELNGRQVDYVSKLHYSAASLNSIVNDILDFSKLDNDAMDLERIQFSMDEVFGYLKSMYAAQAREKNIELILEVDPNVYDCYLADERKICQVLLNFVSNSLKFTSEGYVAVRVHLVERRDDHDEVCFSVEDTGIGIKRDQQTRMFERFSQAEVGTSRKYGGTGLGLAICKKLCDLMNGEIKLTSEFGEGTRIDFALPLDTNHQSKLAASQTPLQVLLIDGAEHHRESLAMKLHSRDHEVTAVDATQALDGTLLNLNYDLVLLDWSVQDEDKKAVLGKYSAVLALVDYGEVETTDHLAVDRPVLIRELKLIRNESLMDGEAETASSIDPNLRVLLAEDNEVNRIVAEELLESIGISAEYACNGLEAVQSVKDQEFDLVLMDVQMPEMDGIEATKVIRGFKTSKELPIIALTANVLPEDVELYRSIGMDAHVGKPFELEELEAAITSLVKS